MALLHKATLTPSKLELAGGWVTAQPWFAGDGELHLVANFRFDDPLGEVGVETLLLQAGAGPVLQVPLTYRAEELADAQPFLIGTLDHSVLGKRWVYDGVGDPVYLQTLATTVLAGGTEVEMWIDEGAGLVKRTPTATVSGAGSTVGYEGPLVAAGSISARDVDGVTTVHAPGLVVDIVRSPSVHGRPLVGTILSGQWNGHPELVALAAVSTT